MLSRAKYFGLESSGLFKKPSVWVLILANLVPIYSIFFLDWQVFPVLLLFWMENVIIGAYNVCKMSIVVLGNPAKWMSKIFLIPFFCFHYGMFTLIHGVFVFTIFGKLSLKGSLFPEPTVLFDVLYQYQLFLPLLSLFVSHTLSFVFNYIGKDEYKKASLNVLMNEPYARVVVLHLTILFGGFIVMVLGSPKGALLLLVLLKTIIDVIAHVKQHTKYSNGYVQS